MTGGEILGYFKNGQFWGFGGGARDCRRLSGVQGPQAPAGVKGAVGAEPLASLSPLIADLSFYF